MKEAKASAEGQPKLTTGQYVDEDTLFGVVSEPHAVELPKPTEFMSVAVETPLSKTEEDDPKLTAWQEIGGSREYQPPTADQAKAIAAARLGKRATRQVTRRPEAVDPHLTDTKLPIDPQFHRRANLLRKQTIEDSYKRAIASGEDPVRIAAIERSRNIHRSTSI